MKDVLHIIARIEENFEEDGLHNHLGDLKAALEDYKEDQQTMERDLAAEEAEKERAIADAILLRTALITIVRETNETHVGARATSALFETQVQKGERAFNDLLEAAYDRIDDLSGISERIQELEEGRKNLEDNFRWLL